MAYNHSQAFHGAFLHPNIPALSSNAYQVRAGLFNPDASFSTLGNRDQRNISSSRFPLTNGNSTTWDSPLSGASTFHPPESYRELLSSLQSYEHNINDANPVGVGVGTSSPLAERSDEKSPPKAIPRRKGSIKTRQKKKPNIEEENPSDNDYIEKEEQEVNSPPEKKLRKTRGKKRGKNGYKVPQDVKSPVKTSSSPPTRLIRKKPSGIPVPKSLEEATEPDMMMWKWKNAGKNWDEIRKEWQKLTGHLPGHSTLSVRYIKLNENLARNGAANDQDLCRFRKEAEEELLAQLWDRVAQKMFAHNPGSEHNPKELSKRYNMILRSGFDPQEIARLEQDLGVSAQGDLTPENADSTTLKHEETFTKIPAKQRYLEMVAAEAGHDGMTDMKKIHVDRLKDLPPSFGSSDFAVSDENTLQGEPLSSLDSNPFSKCPFALVDYTSDSD